MRHAPSSKSTCSPPALSRQSAGGGARRPGPVRCADAGLHALDQPVGSHFPAAAHAAPAPTTACASSARAASCRLPAIPRWAAATPGWKRAASRRGEYVVQECGVGLVKIRRDAARAASPSPRRRCARAARCRKRTWRGSRAAWASRAATIVRHAWCDNGPNWRGVMLQSAQQVLALKPDAAILAGLDVGVVGPRGKVGVVGSHDAGEDCAFEVRAFFPGNNGIAEDPVTGSLNAALAQWLIGAGLAPRQLRRRAGHGAGPRRPRARASATTMARSGSAAPASPASTGR